MFPSRATTPNTGVLHLQSIPQQARLTRMRAKKEKKEVVSDVNGGGDFEITGVSGKVGDFPEPEADFWEGDGMNAFGTAANFVLPVLVVIAVGVGFFAAQTYNQDATVFLESPKSQVDTAKLYSFE